MARKRRVFKISSIRIAWLQGYREPHGRLHRAPQSLESVKSAIGPLFSIAKMEVGADHFFTVSEAWGTLWRHA